MLAEVLIDIDDGEQVIAVAGERVRILSIINDSMFLASTNDGMIAFAISDRECRLCKQMASGGML